jgi:hypothetical protein
MHLAPRLTGIARSPGALEARSRPKLAEFGHG